MSTLLTIITILVISTSTTAGVHDARSITLGGETAQRPGIVIKDTLVSEALNTGLNNSNDQARSEDFTDGVFFMSESPRGHTLCEETPVYGNPYGIGDVLYTLHKGDEVLLLEPSTLNNGWFMIDTAKWANVLGC